jgi:uncharacterized membrane protein YfcA
MLIWVAVFLVVLLAAAVQAVTGFGFALVAVPLVALLTSAHTSVVGLGLAGVALTLVGAVRERAHVRWRTAGGMVLAALAGMPAGLLVLAHASDALLTAVIAVVCLGCTLWVARPPALPPGRTTMGVAGLASGVLSTSTGVNGPPLVAALHATGFPPRVFRATLAALFSGTGVVAVGAFVLTGQVDHGAVAVGLAGLPATVVGWLCGDLLFHRVDPARFRRIVLGMLVLTSAVTLSRALW